VVDYEIDDLKITDLKELIDYALHREAPPDEEEVACSEVLDAVTRIDRFLYQMQRGDRSVLDVADIADDAFDLAALCMATSPEPCLGWVQQEKWPRSAQPLAANFLMP
jgi:hypothetical protein